MSTPTHSFVTLACARVEAVLAYFGVVVVRQRNAVDDEKWGVAVQKIRCAYVRSRGTDALIKYFS